MAEPIDQLGLGIKEFREAIKEATGLLRGLDTAQDKTTGKTKKMSGALNSVKGLAGALGIPLAIGGLIAALKSLGGSALETGDRINEARDKFIAGSDRLAARGGGDDAPLAETTKTKIQDFGAKVKNSIGSVLNKAIQGAIAVKDIGITPDGGFDLTTSAKKQLHEDLSNEKELNSLRQQRRDIEDEIAALEEQGSNRADDKNKIIEQQKNLALVNQRIAENTIVADRQAANAAKSAAGQKQAQQEVTRESQANEIRSATAISQQVTLQKDGMKEVGAIVAAREVNEAAILKALREGKTELANQLQIQQTMATNAARVAEHNLTSAQLREERTGARKFDRDLAKTVRREADLQQRLDRANAQHDRITPGSRLDRFARAQDARRRVAAAANQALTTKVITTEKIYAKELRVNVP